jgi:predicted phage terminase large subunit-like protein
MRRGVHEWFFSTALTRVHPGGSIIVVHTRWHEDDLIGHLLAQNGKEGVGRWEHVNLPAINDGTDSRRAHGEALWHKRPLAFLEGIRADLQGADGYEWVSLFQGYPRSKTGKLFRDVYTYDALPEGCRYAIGVDGAYTESTHADYSAAVVMAERHGVWYIVDIRHQQVEIEAFAAHLAELAERYPSARFFSRVGGQESAVFRLLKRLDGVRVQTEQTVGDKFMNALGLSASWNAGKVLLPSDVAKAPWSKRVISEVCGFTGIGDKHDDIVDAMVTAHAQLGGGRSRERRQAEDRDFDNQ